MKENRKKQEILSVLAKIPRQLLCAEQLDFSKLQEIRMRAGKPLIVLYQGEEKVLPTAQTEKHIITPEEIRQTLDYISHYSLYAYEQEVRQGFITIEGGHRIGLAGKVVLEKNKVKNLQYISSVNLRVAHEIKGCADQVIKYITQERKVCHTLLLSPPGCGKTTLIRDLIRQISDGNCYVKGCTVGVVDERSELGGCYKGVPQNDLGKRTDILDCCPKAEGMLMLIRAMSPGVIAVDEIGTAEDVQAIEYAMQCGCRMITSAHAASLKEAAEKPALGELIQKKRFERYVVLENGGRPGLLRAVYDMEGNPLCGCVKGGMR